jgi:hypothetical protein
MAGILLATGLLTAGPAGASGGDEHADRKVRTVTYRGFGVDIRRASGDLGKLSRTSPAFQRVVRNTLNQMWRASGAEPRCATAPVITVKRWRSDGWVRIENIGLFNPCPSGGAWEIWRVHGHHKRVVLGGQDRPRCKQLTRRHVPAGIADTCYKNDQLVTYKP